MRCVFIGAGTLSVLTAEMLLKKGAEVVIIEKDEELIQSLAEKIDCGFIHADGSNPDVLKEVDPHNTDVLFSISSSDQTNILASLLGRSLGFKRIFTKIDDPGYRHICVELGLQDLLEPEQEIAESLVDNISGQHTVMLGSILQGDVRFYHAVLGEACVEKISTLNLPKNTLVIAVVRDEHSLIASSDLALKAGDEVVCLTTDEQFEKLEKMLAPQMLANHEK